MDDPGLQLLIIIAKVAGVVWLGKVIVNRCIRGYCGMIKNFSKEICKDEDVRKLSRKYQRWLDED